MSRNTNFIVFAACLLTGALTVDAVEVVSFGSRSFITGDGVSSLDLTAQYGSFAYAVDLGRNGGTNQTVAGVTFTAQNTTPGVTINPAGSDMGGTSPSPSYTGHADSAALNSVLAVGHWGDLTPPNYPGSVSLVVVPGKDYKLQILYYEGFGPGTQRRQDLSIEGALAVDNLEQNTGQGTLYSYTFNAADASLNITWTGGNISGNTTVPGDIWTHMDGLTLEVLPEPSAFSILALASVAMLRRKRRA